MISEQICLHYEETYSLLTNTEGLIKFNQTSQMNHTEALYIFNNTLKHFLYNEHAMSYDHHSCQKLSAKSHYLHKRLAVYQSLEKETTRWRFCYCSSCLSSFLNSVLSVWTLLSYPLLSPGSYKRFSMDTSLVETSRFDLPWSFPPLRSCISNMNINHHEPKQAHFGM